MATDPEPISHILAHIGEPTAPSLGSTPHGGHLRLTSPSSSGAPEAAEVVQPHSPDDLDQTPPFDPTGSDSIPDDDIDQRRSA